MLILWKLVMNTHWRSIGTTRVMTGMKTRVSPSWEIGQSIQLNHRGMVKYYTPQVNPTAGYYFRLFPYQESYSKVYTWSKPWPNELASWCKFPLATHLCQLVLPLVELNFVCKSMQVFHHLATQGKSIQVDQKSTVYAWNLRLFATCVWTCKPTCESVWPPSASPYASPGLQSCCDLHQLASPFDHGFTTVSIGSVSSCQECWCTRDPPLPHRHSWWLKTEPSVSLAVQQIDLLPLGDQRTQVAALLIRRITRVGFHLPSWKFHT